MTDWKPSADIAMLHKRAALLASVRQFFAVRSVMEVDVPVMAHATVTDPNIESFSVRTPATTSKYYLMTSPEFYIKRLLAAGCGAVYYLGKAFRAEESGSRHSPEFTMLEWYRPQWTAQQLMEEVSTLVANYIDGDIHKTTYRQVFLNHLGIDPHTVSVAALKALAHERLSPAFDSEDRNIWLDLLFSHLVEPQLQGKVFVEQFPAAQAALAQTFVDAYGNRVAARFELYINGVEIANGYQEELDAEVLAARFLENIELRKSRGQTLPPIDEKFLAAMAAGMPPCAGVALGFDRLLMIASGENNIAAVLPFPS
ncbi:MAG TPA: EF-P lysine aminoacylase EpmA [Pseudomonadales bacterium]|nr:EF-P lysine aminoacylase EpmA [Pseudomonadales bacterium]